MLGYFPSFSSCSFLCIKKNERSEYTMDKWIILYEACCLVTICLLSNNLGNKKANCINFLILILLSDFIITKVSQLISS